MRWAGGEDGEKAGFKGLQRGRLFFCHPPPPFPSQSKIQAALDKAAFLPSPLTGVTLTLIDIASLPDGGGPLALEVPVVAWRTPDGTEVRVPRSPPRATADKVAATLVEAKPESD